MQNKSTAIVIGIIVIILAIVAITLANRTDTPPGTEEPTSSASPMGTSTPATSTPSTMGTSTSMKTYTMSEVAMHKTASDCWTVISGSVYNLTSFVTKHPGGVEAITKICGIDGTTIFNGQHGGMAPQAAALATVKIGTLAQ
jgi:cytochrome b involved in lipid metabolism